MKTTKIKICFDAKVIEDSVIYLIMGDIDFCRRNGITSENQDVMPLHGYFVLQNLLKVPKRKRNSDLITVYKGFILEGSVAIENMTQHEEAELGGRAAMAIIREFNPFAEFSAN